MWCSSLRGVSHVADVVNLQPVNSVMHSNVWSIARAMGVRGTNSAVRSPTQRHRFRLAG